MVRAGALGEFYKDDCNFINMNGGKSDDANPPMAITCQALVAEIERKNPPERGRSFRRVQSTVMARKKSEVQSKVMARKKSEGHSTVMARKKSETSQRE